MTCVYFFLMLPGEFIKITGLEEQDKTEKKFLSFPKKAAKSCQKKLLKRFIDQ